jgi:hypothetical protein
LLPATLAALRAGRIDVYRARIIWEQTQVLADRPALRAQVEAAALAVGEAKTAPALREFIKRKVAALDPAGAEQRRKSAWRSRGVGKPCPEDDGMASMGSYGPLEDLAAFWTALDAAARARRDAAAKDASHPFAGVCLDALRFDVLADLGYAALACGHLGCCNPDCAGMNQRLGTRQGKQAQVTVRMGAGTAAGLDALPAVVEGFGAITAEAARAFAADATWRRLLTDPVSGALLDYGRTTYAPPQALRDFVVAQDRTCRFPTCSWPAESSDLDHEPVWADGGRTSPDGMISLHRRHHNSKTHHGCQIDEPAPGVLIWRTATGHTYRIDPEIADLLTELNDPAIGPGSDPPSDPDPPPSSDPPF